MTCKIGLLPDFELEPEKIYLKIAIFHLKILATSMSTRKLQIVKKEKYFASHSKVGTV